MRIGRWLQVLPLRFRSLFRRARVEQELEEEILDHLERQTALNVAAGMSPADARAAARRAFGTIEAHKERVRDTRGVQLVDDLMRDLNYATGTLRRSPGFAATTILTLAIGISATTLVFSVVDALFFRRLPVRDPGQLYVVQETWKNGVYGPSDMGQFVYPYDHFLDFAQVAKAEFSDVAASAFDVVAVREGPYAHDMTGVLASSNYFAVLGVRPALGRFFSVTDERSSNVLPEVVIGHEMWERDFNSDTGAIGRTLYADSRALTIVGVAPREFIGTTQGIVAELWIPAGVLRLPVPGVEGSKGIADFNVAIFGRLRPGISVRQAMAQLAVTAPQLPAEHQAGHKQWITGVRLDQLSSMPSMTRGAFEIFMAILTMTAAVVLLIAIANVAGMLLARGAYRRKEIATRLALGASRERLVRQLLVESLLLSALGALGGLALVRWLIALIPAIPIPAPVRVAFDVRLNPQVLAITLIVAVATAVLAGLAPALESTRMDVVSGLRGGGATHKSRSRDAFVTAQLALALVLLITATLFGRALDRALTINPGLDPKGVLTAEVDLYDQGYSTDRAEVFFSQFLARLRARPEVADASIGKWTPLSLNNNGEGVLLPGEQAPTGRRAGVSYGVVGVGYLEMMHVPIVNGRSFTSGDVLGAPNVIIVNETMAKRFWPGEPAIGRTVKLSGVDREVIGIARDGKYKSLDESPQNYAFLPFAQRRLQFASLFVRARGDSSVLPSVLRRELAALDPNVALASPMSMSGKMSILVLPQRVAAAVVGAFGAVGLLLSMVGIYGVVAYHVSQRRREFGIRLTLGAGRSALVRLVLRRGFVLIGIAVGTGSLLAIGVTTLARRFLFGLGALDPMTFVIVPVLLTIVAVVASYVPARRAGHADPIESLRAE